jgi:membrane-bound serine protease (ClpP class)
MSPWKKYLLLQIPGWLITATVVTVLWRWQLFPGWLALLCFSLWLIIDLVLYPLLRRAYENSAPTGSAALIGARGVAQGDLNPSGYVRVRGELWLATAVPADRVVAAGTEVTIVNAERMKLFVRAVK